MQANRNAPNRVPSGTVVGLGVSDVLRLELRAVQVPWLIEELEENRTVIDDAIQLSVDPDSPHGTPEKRELLRYDSKLIRLMRASLPESDRGDDVVFAGPARLVIPLVEGTLHHVAETFFDETTHRFSNDPAGWERLRETAAAVTAWVETYLDMKELERFNFDPDADPYDWKAARTQIM